MFGYRIAKETPNLNIKINQTYLVAPNLIKKCSKELWNEILIL